MRITGLEPARITAQDPKSCVSANSTISAYIQLSAFMQDCCAELLRYPELSARYPLRIIPTAAPFHPPFIRHRRQSGSMLPIPPYPHKNHIDYFSTTDVVCKGFNYKLRRLFIFSISSGEGSGISLYGKPRFILSYFT